MSIKSLNELSGILEEAVTINMEDKLKNIKNVASLVNLLKSKFKSTAEPNYSYGRLIYFTRKNNDDPINFKIDIKKSMLEYKNPNKGNNNKVKVETIKDVIDTMKKILK